MKTILIIEDEEFLSNVLIVQLTSLATVELKKNVAEAIEYLKEYSPNLIVLDLMLPGGDGRGVLRYLQEQSKDIPVIVATNLDKEEVNKECHELGAHQVVIKSNVSIGGLVDIITTYL